MKFYPICILLPLLSGLMVPSSLLAAACDIDADGDVDRSDILQVAQARNATVVEQNDPRDANGDGVINVLDARSCVLQCSLPRCESVDPNTAPEIVTSPVTQSTLGMTYNYDVDADDGENDTLTFNLELAPPGMTIDVESGLIEWTPDVTQLGEHEVQVRASDTRGLADTQSFSIDVVLGNAPLLELAFVDSFELIWSNYGSEGNFTASFFKPEIPAELSDFSALGHFGYQGLFTVPNGYMLVARELVDHVLKEPASFTRVWGSVGLDSVVHATFWKPNAQPGYDCLGLLVKSGPDLLSPPNPSEIKCVHQSITIPNSLAELPVNKYRVELMWDTAGSTATTPFVATQILPNKAFTVAGNDLSHAIHVGTFTGSSTTNVFQDMTLASWIDGRYVLQQPIDPGDIDGLIQAHAPFIWLHPDEDYLPDDPDLILDLPTSNLCWGLLLNELEPSDYEITNWDCAAITSATLMPAYRVAVEANPLFNDPVTRPLFRYWIEIPDDWKNGSMIRAKALVNVLPVDAIFTDIQFWIFYPFNGPGRVEVCPLQFEPCLDHTLYEVGRHYGDWEHVTLRFLNRDKNLVAVYMSRHDKGQWFSRNYFNDTLQVINGYPVVYSALYSHALYPSINDHFVYHITREDAALIKLWDKTGAGIPFPTINNYEIISSSIDGVPNVTNPPWLNFTGRWGQYEYLKDVLGIPILFPPFSIPYPYDELGTGPTGLNLKDAFKYGDSHDWFWYPTID